MTSVPEYNVDTEGPQEITGTHVTMERSHSWGTMLQ
jgi:hypothetical protein